MNKRITRIFFTTLMLFLSASYLSSRAQTPVGIYQFNGIATRGGTSDMGTLFTTQYDGTKLNVKKSFTISNEGSADHMSKPAVCNGKLYAILHGVDGYIICEYDPLTKKYQKKAGLSNLAKDLHDASSLTSYNNRLYGVVLSGDENYGFIYEYNPASTSTAPPKIMRIFVSNTGRIPCSNLSVFGDGLYGITNDGGNYDLGGIFEFNTETKKLIKKFDFNNGSVRGELQLINYDGTLYGNGNDGANAGLGGIFSYHPANGYKILQTYSNSKGIDGVGDFLIHGGRLWGWTREGAEYGNGCLFQYGTVSNTYEDRINLGGMEGIHPSGNVVYTNNKIYGIAARGGKYNGGVLFEYDAATDTYTPKKSLSNFVFPYGFLTSLTLYMGKIYFISNGSTLPRLYRYNPVLDKLDELKQFNDPNKGESPLPHLTELNGILYGTCLLGGLNDNGSIFAYNIATADLQYIAMPIGMKKPSWGALTIYNSKLYDVYIFEDEDIDELRIVEFNPIDNTFTPKAAFDLNEFYPAGAVIPFDGSLTVYKDKMYGSGFDQSGAILYQYNPATDKINQAYSLGEDILPGKMTLTDDKFYELAQNIFEDDGGAASLFEYDPVANSFNKKQVLGKHQGSHTILCELTRTPAPAAKGKPGTCFIASSNAIISASNNKQWVPFTDGYGNAIAEINANGNNLGNVSLKYFVNNGAVRKDINGKAYLDRNVTFTIQNPTASSVKIRLYARNEEIKTLINTPGSAVTKAQDIGIYFNKDVCSPKIASKATLTPTGYEAWGFDHVFGAASVTGLSTTNTFYLAAKSFGSLAAVMPLTEETENNYFNKSMQAAENPSATSSLSVSISPNPVASNMANLQIYSPKAQVVLLTVTDITGRTLITQTIKANVGSNQAKIDVSKLNNGFIYQLVYSVDGKTNSIKFVK